MCDREADGYEYLQSKIECEERCVVRASWARRVTGETGHLFAALEGAPLRGTQGIRWRNGAVRRVVVRDRRGWSCARGRLSCVRRRVGGG